MAVGGAGGGKDRGWGEHSPAQAPVCWPFPTDRPIMVSGSAKSRGKRRAKRQGLAFGGPGAGRRGQTGGQARLRVCADELRVARGLTCLTLPPFLGIFRKVHTQEEAAGQQG